MSTIDFVARLALRTTVSTGRHFLRMPKTNVDASTAAVITIAATRDARTRMIPLLLEGSGSCVVVCISISFVVPEIELGAKG